MHVDLLPLNIHAAVRALLCRSSFSIRLSRQQVKLPPLRLQHLHIDDSEAESAASNAHRFPSDTCRKAV